MTRFSYKKLTMALMTYLFAVPSLVLARDSYVVTYFDSTCNGQRNPLGCWAYDVFEWSQIVIPILATVVIIFAGAIYMTSAGNPNRIGFAKKLITGALTGVAIIILGRFFVTYVIGVEI